MIAYVVMTSNCEMYEDYHEYIDSVWSSRELAVDYIERRCGMEQVQFQTGRGDFLDRDRWKREEPVLAEREDSDTDEEWAEVLRDFGDPPVIYTDERDMWIEAYQMDGKGAYDEEEEA